MCYQDVTAADSTSWVLKWMWESVAEINWNCYSSSLFFLTAKYSAFLCIKKEYKFYRCHNPTSVFSPVTTLTTPQREKNNTQALQVPGTSQSRLYTILVVSPQIREKKKLIFSETLRVQSGRSRACSWQGKVIRQSVLRWKNIRNMR